MPQDKLQLQRFELKYIVREEVALAVRDFVRPYLEIDEFGATHPKLSYPVHSLYLDSDSLVLYWHTINGNKNRVKLRIRFYENQPDAPVFFEIKRRMNDAILKQRGAVRREFAESLIAGHLPEPRHLVSNDPKHLVAIQRFCQLMTEYQAKPRAHVAYLREAWISPQNNSVRVTMDRDVQCAPESTSKLSATLIDPVLVFGNLVVLELKFTGRYPDWFRDLVRVFGLTQCSAAKYADGIALGGERRFSGERYRPPTDESSRERLADRRRFLLPLQQTAGAAIA